MAMKQTQTKLFNFSDTGLDFCSGSKNLFPDRFKKMLALGYNVQTVSSVAVAGSQVTLTYGVSHGYVADRVLKVDSGALASINGGEFWVDLVTTNTVTFTLDSAPSSVLGGFTTRIAPLGWSLEYEQPYVHLYKMKNLDESDLYVRLVFQAVSNYRNRVGVCVGHATDVAAGTITDTLTLTQYATATVPNDTFAWEFQLTAEATYNNQTAAQGLVKFGACLAVGSKYHLAIMGNLGTAAAQYVNGIFPTHTFNYDNTNYPLLCGTTYGNPTTNGYNYQGAGPRSGMMLGKFRCIFQETNLLADQPVAKNPVAYNSFLPTEIDNFNTTTCKPIPLILQQNGQMLGYVAGGMYLCSYAATNAPKVAVDILPLKTVDIDLNSNVYVHTIPNGGSDNAFYAIPVEEIKIVS